MTKPKPVRSLEPAPERASRPRQRQKLIDACISALHAYGPSRTTVDKVVAIAEMSPGIVSFYFDSKAAMLVAALQFLADEFDSQVMAPVRALADRPVDALETLVRLMLDPEIASPRKVSVWYAFWGEANSRQEYYDICGKKDDAFAATVFELVERMVAQAANPDLDADAIALGLIGVLEILWQNIAFQDEARIDRVGAERRAMAYLRSIFPRQFTGTPTPVVQLAPPRDPFLTAWHFVGLESGLTEPGDYAAIEAAGERALVLRGQDDSLIALNNACRHRPHALVAAGAGHLDGRLVCPVDGTVYDLAGRAGDGAALRQLETACSGGMVFLRFLLGGAKLPILPPAPSGVAAEAPIAHDIEAAWQIVLELLIERHFGSEDQWAIIEGGAGLARQGDDHGGADSWRRCLFPNLLIDVRSDRVSLWQLQSLTPDRSRLGVQTYRRPGTGSAADETLLAALVQLANSTQIGLSSSLYEPASAALPGSAVAALQAWLRQMAA